jgi:hypothetical protein
MIRSKHLEVIWMTTAEILVEPGDMPSGDTKGFMRITVWADSVTDVRDKLERYLSKYRWHLLSLDNTYPVDETRDYGDELNEMIDQTMTDHNAIRLGTFYSYKVN